MMSFLGSPINDISQYGACTIYYNVASTLITIIYYEFHILHMFRFNPSLIQTCWYFVPWTITAV